MARVTKLQQEQKIVEDLISELERKIKALELDPLSDEDELTQATQLVTNARTRLQEVLDKQSGHLQPQERRIATKEGTVVINAAGCAEEDIANPQPVPPAPLKEGSLSEADSQQLLLDTGTAAFDQAVANAETVISGAPSSDAAPVGAFEDVVIVAASLGYDALFVSQQWSQLSMLGFGTEYTKTGLHALRLQVENRFMLDQLGKLGSQFMDTQKRITALRKPARK